MTCDVCGQIMLTGRSCLPSRSLVYGAERTAPCRDCGTPPGGHHHPGCCVAVCGQCGQQTLRIPAFDAWQESCQCPVQ